LSTKTLAFALSFCFTLKKNIEKYKFGSPIATVYTNKEK